MKTHDLTIGINIDMQHYYDNLVLYRDSLNAQIKRLEESPAVCTHTKTEIKETELGNFVICKNRACNKVLETPEGVDWAY